MNANIQQKDLYLWGEGTNIYSYLTLGCHAVEKDGYPAYRFAVWAPNAVSVSVVGDFNGWNLEADPMEMIGTTGVWQAFIGIAHEGDAYKFAIRTKDGDILYKADPFAFASQLRPNTASRIWDIGGYQWTDQVYMARRAVQDHHASPVNIYEVHLGSWKKDLSFTELSEELVRYVVDMGYTHIELMPLCEYPLDESWGYQITGYFSITARYGTPQDFQHFVDVCHRNGIGVILDWVPAHFCRDEQGLRRFDGTPLFEHPDSRRAEQPHWGTLLFNYEKNEVRSFLLSNAMYFLREFHVDGLRVDAVSCMLYLDYGRQGGEWLPNRYGGKENLGAIDLFRQLSLAVRQEFPGALLIAEESTAFAGVTASPEEGGLGFDYKWNMGWMNDTLSYMSMDSLFRKWHHNQVTFSMCYAFSEHYILPFSHDEVVHGKCSLINRMPGEYEDKFRQLRLLLMYQFAHPGKKLNFMGYEFGQFIEWDFRKSLDWFLLGYPAHRDMQVFTRQLNRFYSRTPALYEQDDGWQGFEWVSVDDDVHSILAFIRRDSKGNELLCAFNFTPVKHDPYRIQLPRPYLLSQAMSNVDFREMHGIQSQEDPQGGEYVDIMLSPYEAVYYYLTVQPRPKPKPKLQRGRRTVITQEGAKNHDQEKSGSHVVGRGTRQPS